MTTENQNSDSPPSSEKYITGIREIIDRLFRRHQKINAYTYEPRPQPAPMPEMSKTPIVTLLCGIFQSLSQATTRFLPAVLQFIKVDGHHKYANPILLFLVYFIFAGPGSNYPRIGFTAVAISTIFLTLIINKFKSLSNVLWLWHLLLAGFSCLAVFLVDRIGLVEKSFPYYPHFYIVLGAMVLLVQLLISTLSKSCLLRGFSRLRHNIDGKLPMVDMFYSEADEKIERIGPWGFICNAGLGVVYQLTKVLFFPACLILMSPDLYQTPIRVWMLASITLLYVAIFSSHQRFQLLLEVLDGLFFRGGPLVVSLLIIVLAGLHLFGVSYVSTLIESSPGTFNATIFSYLVSVYVLFWFYEYWINRALLEYFVGLFKKDAGREHPGKIVFAQGNDDDRLVLQAHGSSQLLLYKHESGKKKYNLFTRRGFLDRLVSKLERSDEFCAAQIQSLKMDVEQLKQAMRSYFLMVNLSLLVMAGFLIWFNNARPQLAALTVRAEIPQEEVEELFNLREQIFKKQATDKLEPLILLAGSGGGSRAAMYTQSVMRGLHEQGYLKNMLLTSTVSGGGAAAGYFAMHREQLLNTPVCKASVDAESRCLPDSVSSLWEEFSRTMTEPYILDVLQGAADLRLALGVDAADYHADIGSYTARFRFANLLMESMANRLPGDLGRETLVRNLGDQKDLGLIFNTTVMARFPRWSCNEIVNKEWKACLCSANGAKKPPLAVSEASCKKALRTSVDQGGRLALTNLMDVGGFPQPDLSVPNKEFNDDYLHYAVINDPRVEIPQAVALSANFPVVFPNSAVDIGNLRRYWITDGGVADNRGLLSLLFVLRDAVKSEIDSQCAHPCTIQDGMNQLSLQCPSGKSLPPIHVVVADASAINLSADRINSIGAAISRSPLLAGQVIRELGQQIKQYYQCLGGEFYMHELPMPLVLRSGGLGTHWMLPNIVSFTQPRDISRLLQPEDDNQTHSELDKEEVRTLVDQLHSEQRSSKNNRNLNRVWQWIRDEQYANHPEAWSKLLLALNKK